MPPESFPPEKPHTRLSAVIPVLHDIDALRLLLKDLLAAEAPPDEILVVDGGAQDRCLTLCNEMHCTYINTAACRGLQLRVGAETARGDIFWFLHADTRPARTAAANIRRAVRDGACGGYLRFRFGGSQAWYKSLLAWMINRRARIGLPYGDQGLFVSRSAYTASGGFTDLPLFEEVPLIRAVRQQGPFVAIDSVIDVSPRRWERDGWVRRTLKNRLLALGYMTGISPHALARRYRPISGNEKVQC